MKHLLAIALAAASLSAQAPPSRTFVGSITDEMCAGVGHQVAMRMGPTDEECTLACVEAHGSLYVLEVNAKEIYALSDQQTPSQFAGRKVRVTGTLDDKDKKIVVASIVAAD